MLALVLPSMRYAIRAEIADNDTVSTDGNTRTSQLNISKYNPITLTGALITAPVIDVKAHTGGNIGSYTVTGSVVNYTDDTSPGFVDKLKKGYSDLTTKAAGIVGLTQSTVAKNDHRLNNPNRLNSESAALAAFR